MKNCLKMVLSVVLFGLLGFECEKDSTEPKPSTAGKFTVSSTTFKDGKVHHSQLIDLKSPQLSWANAPKGTKEFLFIMDDHNKHTYWIGTLHHFSHEKAAPDKDENGYRRSLLEAANDATQCTIEIFALNATANELKEENVFDDLEGQKIDITREVFRNHINKKRPGTILGTASATYQLVK